MKDYALIASAYDKSVRIYAAHTTNLVEHARQIHKTWPTATAAFGRFLTVSVMMGLMYKKDERITLRIKGDGPISSMLVEANSKGEVRGEINNPEVYIKYTDGPKKGKLNVGEAVGKGVIYITKDLNMKEFFTSSSEIQTGEIADDFTYYFALSEQVPTSIGLGVLVNTDQSVLASGGYILQLMPDASEEVITHLESVISNLKPISTLIHEGKTPEEIISLLSDGTSKILDKKDLSYVCHCSKDGFARSLCSLDEQTMRELIDEDEGAEIICHFCHEKYHFTKSELEDLNIKRKEK
ncbi:Hsp33 family molecular chaperone HslO [Mariniplasma anaerobium]|uniref:33 kDa chaperonin n=1 Tax=Mariniplasma anaerobium TaxID=2735436 RepID=A0A7U9XV31_9MOLU|nr:Hsp33 family molecular chaperone HslO [Mariniplasma anaerobium]BCR35290.1 33 kDa chaperonin [Mariniplasma anaerobium]